MPTEIQYSNRFRKQYRKADHSVRASFDRRLTVFIENNHAPQLHNHALKGKYKGMRSVNVTGDWRALFYEIGTGESKTILFELLATHSQLYG